MATKNYEKLDDVFIKGEIQWACVFEPNTMNDTFEITVIPDDVESVRELGVTIHTGFKDSNGNLYGDSYRDKLDEEGNKKYTVEEDGIEYVKIPGSKNALYGPKVMFDEAGVAERNDKGHVIGPKIGNGSYGLVKCDLARTKFGPKYFLTLKRPSKVRVISLVRYTNGESRDEEMYKD